MHDDLRNRLVNLEALVQQVVEDPPIARPPENKKETSVTTPAGPLQTVDEVVVQQVMTDADEGPSESISEVVELLPADSSEGESAMVIVEPEIIEIAPDQIEIPDEKNRTEFYESATGELQADRRSRDRVIDIDPDTDQRSRVDLAPRLFKGWDIETLVRS